MGLRLSSSPCEPRRSTPRRIERPSAGPAAAAVAEQLGQPFMPWQRLVADVALEMLDDGRPAYRMVIVTVPRQQGKTILQLAVMIQRALGWAGPQRMLYSAQSGNDARKKLVDDWSPILTPRRARLGISRILKGMGNEAVEFRNGSLMVLLASSEESGHGKTLDLALHDEIFKDKDFRREQATGPGMLTRRSAQTWFSSTMGTEASVLMNAKVEQGRTAVMQGRDTGVAYFEWSADPAMDPADPATWWSCMPALGYTVDEDVIREMQSSMPDGEFRRACLNQPTMADERVIPAALWEAVVVEVGGPKAGEGQVFAVDVAPDRSSAAIAAADMGFVEIVESREGSPVWVAGRVAELAARWDAPVVVDVSSPAGALLVELERANVRIMEASVRDVVQATGQFFDAVVDGSFRVLRNLPLDAAVEAAAKRSVGDAWTWARKSETSIAPLVAATLARWAAVKIGDYDPVASVW